jgi:hypothetical protein
MSCLLRICGKKSLNIDEFDFDSHLKPTTVHRKGDFDFRKLKIKKSQILFTASNADNSDLSKQIKDAIKFLKKNEIYLKTICLNKKIEYSALDFSFNSRINRKTVAVQHDYFPSELVRLAGNLNIAIWLTQWPYEKAKKKK